MKSLTKTEIEQYTNQLNAVKDKIDISFYLFVKRSINGTEHKKPKY